MNVQGSANKLEWITCPYDSATFQIAIPASVSEIRISTEKFETQKHYTLDISCPECDNDFYVLPDVPSGVSKRGI